MVSVLPLHAAQHGFYARPTAHRCRLFKPPSIGTISCSSGIVRFVQGGVVKTFRYGTSRTAMDADHKDAYRYLLYWAMLDIRGIAWYRFQWWRPWRLLSHLRHSRRAGYIADAMHNLAQHAALDFEHFDENDFWSHIDYAHSQLPQIDPARYRKLFDDRLTELQSRGPVA